MNGKVRLKIMCGFGLKRATMIVVKPLKWSSPKMSRTVSSLWIYGAVAEEGKPEDLFTKP